MGKDLAKIEGLVTANHLVLPRNFTPAQVGATYHALVRLSCSAQYFIGDILLGLENASEEHWAYIDQLSDSSERQYRMVSMTFQKKERKFGVKWRFHRLLAEKIKSGKLEKSKAMKILQKVEDEGLSFEEMQGEISAFSVSTNGEVEILDTPPTGGKSAPPVRFSPPLVWTGIKDLEKDLGRVKRRLDGLAKVGHVGIARKSQSALDKIYKSILKETT
jgi:hypothetical protein